MPPWHVKFQSSVINSPQDKEWKPFGRQTDRRTDEQTSQVHNIIFKMSPSRKSHFTYKIGSC